MKKNEKTNNPGGQNLSGLIGNAPILIDGSNVVMENAHYGWRVLKTLLDWLKRKGQEYFLYFDANILHQIKEDSGKKFIATQLSDKEHTYRCGAGYKADNYILRHANKTGGHIISNDNYRDYAEVYKLVCEKRGNRRIHKFLVIGGLLIIDELNLNEEICADTNNIVRNAGTQDLMCSSLGVRPEKKASYDKSTIDKLRKKADEWRKKAEQGDAEAQYCLGLCYYVGSGEIGSDLKKAEELLRKATNQGHAKAERALSWLQFEIGLKLYYGNLLSAAARWFLKAAEHGDEIAQCRIGRCYQDGEGVKKDFVEAAKWYRKAAEQGYGRAQRGLAICYCKGTGVKKDLEEAEKWWRRMIEQGDGCAKTRLAKLSYAADKGDTIAQYEIGKFFMGSESVDSKSQLSATNPWLAVKWFRKAAEQGHVDAQYEFAELCADGFFSDDDDMCDAEAEKWYREAAEQGHVDAQFKLGECYSYGRGVTEDKSEAAKWYRRAAEQGHEEAISMRLLWDKSVNRI